MGIIKKVGTLAVRMSEQEQKMLTAVCGRYGIRASEYIRGLIRKDYEKMFPVYAMKKIVVAALALPEEDLTDEQFCEKWGGKVEGSVAGKKCRVGNWVMMVTDRDNIKKRGKELTAIRNLKNS